MTLLVALRGGGVQLGLSEPGQLAVQREKESCHCQAAESLKRPLKTAKRTHFCPAALDGLSNTSALGW